MSSQVGCRFRGRSSDNSDVLTAAPTRAAVLAAENFEKNLGALRSRQPRIVDWLEEESPESDWLFARDGTLSGRDGNNRWISGCSVPARLSQIVLRDLTVRGSVACFLVPTHASDLRFTLDKLSAAQAIIVLLPKYAELATMLHCADFTADICHGRLYVIAGPAWDVEFSRLLDEQADLATPSSFIRLPATSEAIIDPLLTAAQSIINAANERRANNVAQLRERYSPPRQNKICIAAPMKFRLWNDFAPAFEAIADAPGKLNVKIFDTDDPANTAPQALVTAACAADVLMTTNTARTDLPGLIPNDLPWISLITGTRVPSAALAGDNDRLLLNHASLQSAALNAGWQTGQIQIVDLPSFLNQPRGMNLSLICDTACLATPTDLSGYSSHSVLWETLRDELTRNPFALKRIDAYLQQHQERLHIADSAFSKARFIDQLIVPAYAQGLARALIQAKIPVQLFGRGWSQIDGLADSAKGEINSRDDLHTALRSSIALVHPLVSRAGHPVLRSGLPVVAALDANTFLRLARQALNGRLVQINDPTPTLSTATLQTLVSEISN